MKLVKLNWGDLFLRNNDHICYTYHGMGFVGGMPPLVVIATDEQGTIHYLRPEEEVTLCSWGPSHAASFERR